MLDGTSEPVTPTSGELPSDEGMKPSRFRLGRVIGVSPELPVGARVLARLADPKGPPCKRYVPCVLFLTLGNKQVRRTGVCRSALSLSASFIVYVSCDNCHGVSLIPLFATTNFARRRIGGGGCLRRRFVFVGPQFTLVNQSCQEQFTLINPKSKKVHFRRLVSMERSRGAINNVKVIKIICKG